MIINCYYGGPGAGKSTKAMELCADAKKEQRNVELVTEYVKQWVWENRKPVSLDQFYFFAKQSRKEYSLIGKVDEIFTDSPVSLIAYYTKVFGTTAQKNLFIEMYKFYESNMTEQGCSFNHFWVHRKDRPYMPHGRFQTEEQAKEIDIDMRIFLAKEIGIQLIHI